MNDNAERDNDELRELMKRLEPLDPELERCIEAPAAGTSGLSFIKHPLVVTVHHPMMNALHNAQLKHKRAHVAELIEAKNYVGAVWLHERAYRFMAFKQYHERMSATEAAELLLDVWTDTEFPGPRSAEWLGMFRRYAPHSPTMLKSRAAFSGKRKLTVYRGMNATEATGGYGLFGLGWSRKMQVAAWFARRFRAEGGAVMRATIDPHRHVFAYNDSRNEAEVILDPSGLRDLAARPAGGA